MPARQAYGYPFLFVALGELELRRRGRDRKKAGFRAAARVRSQPDGAPISRSAHERVRTRRYAIFSHVVLNRLRRWVRKENANHPVESVNAVHNSSPGPARPRHCTKRAGKGQLWRSGIKLVLAPT